LQSTTPPHPTHAPTCRAFQQAKGTIDRRDESEREKERQDKAAEELKKKRFKDMFERL